MKIVFNQSTKLFSISSDLSELKKLNDFMNREFQYGAVIGKKFYSDEEYPDRDGDYSEVDWKKYKSRPLKDIIKDHRGTCWEYTNYTHYMLNKLGIPHTNYFIFNGHDSHTFTIAHLGKDDYWIESAFWKNHGVHKIKSLEDIGKYYDKPYDIYEFDVDKVANKSIQSDDYVDNYATSGDIVYQKHFSVSSDITLKDLSYDELMTHKKDPKWKGLQMSHTIDGRERGRDYSYIIAFNGKNPVGIAILDNDGKELIKLVVDPDQRKSGIGTKLVKEVIDRGCNKLFVRKNNDKAINLYLKMGFKFTGYEQPAPSLMIEMKK